MRSAGNTWIVFNSSPLGTCSRTVGKSLRNRLSFCHISQSLLIVCVLSFKLTNINLCPVLPIGDALDNERMVAADGLYVDLVSDLSYTSGVDELQQDIVGKDEQNNNIGNFV